MPSELDGGSHHDGQESSRVSSLSADDVFRKRRRLKRELAALPVSQEIRIAILGGTTTDELAELLEVHLLAEDIRPVIWQSQYKRYFEDAVVDPGALREFRPDIVYVHTHVVNIGQYPAVSASEADLEDAVAAELSRFRSIWNAIDQEIGCQVIQNNFEMPAERILGNLDGIAAGGRGRFILEMNRAFAREAAANRRLVIHDVNALSAGMGLGAWFDRNRWFSYKILTTPEASVTMARSLAAVIGAIRGKAKKCLVLDLDNTLWGGVIGDDGLDRIQIGRETAVAESYTAFQQYCLSLHERGVLLAVCSKNNEDTARSGFSHPDTVLKPEHFAAFKANWNPKPENIQEIAKELNIGLDSLVFVDDNPAERAIVSAQIPAVAVPDVGSEVAHFAAILEAGRYFETVSLSREDLDRAGLYAANARRASMAPAFADYGEYLASLKMSAEIGAFADVYLDRITQLINKTNQFNLTTRRYTLAEVQQIANSPDYISLYGRLRDSFGDNGLISVIIGRRDGASLHLDLWIMSCRVLKRDMELAMLDALVERSRANGIRTIHGYFRHTPRNEMVRWHYRDLGFEPAENAADGTASVWTLAVENYIARNKHILVKESING